MTDQYNDHYEGLAFVNRIRVVTPNHGDPYPALSLAVKHGAKKKDEGDQWTEPLQCKVVTERAMFVHAKILSMLEDHAKTHKLDLKKDWKQLPSISAKFKAGDLKPDCYMNQSGTPVPFMKGRLLRLTDVYVDGELFYKGEDEKDSSPSSHDHAQDDEKDQQHGSAQASSPEQSAPPAASTDHAGHAEQRQQRQTPEFDPWMGEPLPDRVKLNKADPMFQQKKAHLKQQDYRWNSKEQLWYRPEAVAA